MSEADFMPWTLDHSPIKGLLSYTLWSKYNPPQITVIMSLKPIALGQS